LAAVGTTKLSISASLSTRAHDLSGNLNHYQFGQDYVVKYNLSPATAVVLRVDLARLGATGLDWA
jgi:hypothetical protein